MKKVLFVALLAAGFSGIAQDIMPTTAAAVQASLKQQAAMQASSLVKNLPFTQIGPTVMSGRVVDVAVNPDKPTEFYVGYASGGLWYTNNNGTSFSPLMDNAPTQNVGDIAVDSKPKLKRRQSLKKRRQSLKRRQSVQKHPRLKN